MARPRKMSPASYNFYSNLDARHLAHAIKQFQESGMHRATKSTSVLIRTIVESWINSQGGCEIETLEEAKQIFYGAGLILERKERVKDRGYYGNMYVDEEEQDKHEERELKKIDLDALALELVNKAKAQGILHTNTKEKDGLV